MTREELKSCSGFLVQIKADGKEMLAKLYASDKSSAFISPADPAAGWHPAKSYVLSDEDVSSMQPNGLNLISSFIELPSDFVRANK